MSLSCPSSFSHHESLKSNISTFPNVLYPNISVLMNLLQQMNTQNPGGDPAVWIFTLIFKANTNRTRWWIPGWGGRSEMASEFFIITFNLVLLSYSNFKKSVKSLTNGSQDYSLFWCYWYTASTCLCGRTLSLNDLTASWCFPFKIIIIIKINYICFQI